MSLPETIPALSLKESPRRQFLKIPLIIWILIGGALIRIIFMTGVIGSDDLNSLFEAFYITQDSSSQWLRNIPTHHELRTAMIFGLAFFFKILGYSLFSALLLPFICSLLNIFLTYQIARTVYPEKIAVLSAFLYALFPLDVIFATLVFPNNPITTANLMTLFLFIKGEQFCQKFPAALLEKASPVQFPHPKKPAAPAINPAFVKFLYYFLAGVFIGIAYLFQETGIFILLPLFLYFLYQIRRFHIGWIWLMAGALFVFAVETGVYYLTTQVWFYKFIQINLSQNLGFGWNYIPKTGAAGVMPSHFLLEPFILVLFKQEFFPYFFFIFPALGYIIIKKLPNAWFFWIWGISLFLGIAYSSTSPFQYIPLERLPRYFHPCIPPLVILLALFLHKVTWWKGYFRIGSILILILGAIFSVYIDNRTDPFYVQEFLKSVHQNKGIYAVDSKTFSSMIFYNRFQSLPAVYLINAPPANTGLYSHARRIHLNDLPKGGYLLLFPRNLDLMIRQPFVCGSVDKMGRIEKKGCVENKIVKTIEKGFLKIRTLKPEPPRLCRLLETLDRIIPKHLYQKICHYDTAAIYQKL